MLFKSLLIPASIASAAAFASPISLVHNNKRQTSNCNSVQIFIARGSIEPYPGRQGALAAAICQGLPSCGYTDIGYPATFDNYCNSAQAGVTNGTALITAYAERCPEGRIVLTGYSQGGHVVGDILGGGGGNCPMGGTQPSSGGFNPATSPGNNVVAALIFGDVRHTANQPYNAGTGSSSNGIWPRQGAQLSSLNHFSNVLRSWCDGGDPVCAGGNDQSKHTSYFDVFTQEAAAWVKSKL